MRQLREAMSAWPSADRRLAGATLVEARGSTPRQLGLSFVSSGAGDAVGVLSSGCVEADDVVSVADVGTPTDLVLARRTEEA